MGMRIVVLMFAVAMLVALALPALAQAQEANEYPNVASLTAFSAEAQFMSLPGYLRWQTFREQGVWISYAEAERIVTAQQVG